MPELPEVETIARGVDKRVRGDRIVEAWFSGKRPTFKTPAPKQSKGLSGRTILAVHRTGKHIVIELSSLGASPNAHKREALRPGAHERETLRSCAHERETLRSCAHERETLRSCAHKREALRPGAHERETLRSCAQWIVHLGMTGRLLVTAPDSPVAPHTHARLSLESGRELRFVDPRRFGRLEFRNLDRDSAFGSPGDEPLTVGEREFAALFRGRRMSIKAALLNQTLLAGVGNIYADESLFHAGIRPRRRANRLTRLELDRLRLALREILNHAIRLGGSSVSDYVGADGERGFFQMEHCVYQRTGEPCRRCQTPIQRIVLAGRGTHYCPNCQH